jgi:hypothetical protein
MSQTIDAVIDADGVVRLLKPIHLSGARRGLLQYWTRSLRGKVNLDVGYRAMALDEAREVEALDLAEATI